jgi:hypothetical protein
MSTTIEASVRRPLPQISDRLVLFLTALWLLSGAAMGVAVSLMNPIIIGCTAILWLLFSIIWHPVLMGKLSQVLLIPTHTVWVYGQEGRVCVAQTRVQVPSDKVGAACRVDVLDIEDTNGDLKSKDSGWFSKRMFNKQEKLSRYFWLLHIFATAIWGLSTALVGAAVGSGPVTVVAFAFGVWCLVSVAWVFWTFVHWIGFFMFHTGSVWVYVDEDGDIRFEWSDDDVPVAHVGSVQCMRVTFDSIRVHTAS